MPILKPIVLLLLVILAYSCTKKPIYGDFSIKLSGNYMLERNNSIDVYISPKRWNSKSEIIPSKVTRIGFNSNFIIAEQNVLKNRNQFKGDSFQIPIKGLYQYWIIDTKINKIMGPYNLKSFELEKKKMKLEDLNLNDIYSYVELEETLK